VQRWDGMQQRKVPIPKVANRRRILQPPPKPAAWRPEFAGRLAAGLEIGRRARHRGLALADSYLVSENKPGPPVIPARRTHATGPHRASGSGKGTPAAMLVERMKLAHISTGNILRDAVARGTPAGKKADPFMKSGQLVPDELVNELIGDLFGRKDRPEQFVF